MDPASTTPLRRETGAGQAVGPTGQFRFGAGAVRAAVTLCAVFSFQCSGSAPGAAIPGAPPAAYNEHPGVPAIVRDVSMVNDKSDWISPFVPGTRMTNDGRVGLRIQGGPSGANEWRFTLYRPEALREPVMTGPAGLRMTDPQPFDIPARLHPSLEATEATVRHNLICETTAEFAEEGERPNPYACGDALDHDCYDITIIYGTTPVEFGSFVATMWGARATIQVSDPKTANARIVNVEVAEPVEGATILASQEFSEPSVTLDGRLLTGRVGGAFRDWTNPNTGEEFRRMYDLMYAMLPDDAEPCDVTGWTDFHPMSHAPFDAQLVGRYGIAAYPFRDSEGMLIEDGEDMGGSYPWVDREGTNLFMTGMPGTIEEQSQEEFPRRCVVEGCEERTNAIDFDRGFLVAGLWTHGRLVHLDSTLNNVDWAVGLEPRDHYLVDLYQSDEGEPFAVRLGSSRYVARAPMPGWQNNTNILDSQQNLPNHVPEARPVTPRDVVWVMSTGVATDEIVFDDFLDPRAFILSNMQPSITQLRFPDGATRSIPRPWNGQTREAGDPGIIAALTPYELTGEPSDVHIQNGATTLEFEVPAYGLVEAGTGRTEPVALGGVHGRGFWLNGSNRIDYAIPAGSAGLTGNAYVGIFVDVRTTEGASRGLLTFPDGTQVRLVDRSTLQYVSDERVVHEVALGAGETGWMHLGWYVRNDHQEITLLLDGFPFDRWEATQAFFSLDEGHLFVGRGPDLANAQGTNDAGFRGWIDDFKVLIHDLDPEVACNHARGTLIAVGDNQEWEARAEAYPEWAHEQAGAAVGQTSGLYACFHDYTGDYRATLANIPEGSTSLRDAITFPEGPLRAGAPRPDSSGNGFCLSCHTESGIGPMGLDALAFRSDLSVEQDPRRQPMQPMRRVFGVIPRNWIPNGEGPGSPEEAFIASDEGELVDLWVLGAD
ncbi:MAG: hypothetical protein AAF436_09050 [Myxococcota bacterium]